MSDTYKEMCDAMLEIPHKKEGDKVVFTYTISELGHLVFAMLEHITILEERTKGLDKND